MKDTYYTLDNGNLKKVGSVILTAKGYVSNPTEADYAAMVDANGKPNPAFPRSEESFAPPACDEGYHAVPDGYDLKDGKWVKLWKVEPIVYTYDDYDNAMEDYIHQVAVDRGYTRREPSSYDNDPYPRFAQDAKDFKAFRSQVMLYALPILNEYLATGNAPTLEEFKSGFPKIVWTYREEA
jgi:hypothetical protein